MTTKTIDIFSNGTEYEIWQRRNCEKCRKYVPFSELPEEGCEIEFYLSLGGDTPDGISPEFAKRIGYIDRVTWGWMCNEWEADI